MWVGFCPPHAKIWNFHRCHHTPLSMVSSINNSRTACAVLFPCRWSVHEPQVASLVPRSPMLLVNFNVHFRVYIILDVNRRTKNGGRGGLHRNELVSSPPSARLPARGWGLGTRLGTRRMLRLKLNARVLINFGAGLRSTNVLEIQKWANNTWIARLERGYR